MEDTSDAESTSTAAVREALAAAQAAQPKREYSTDEIESARREFLRFRTRCNQIIKTIITVLDSNKLGELEQSFDEEGLELQAFVELLRKHLPKPFELSLTVTEPHDDKLVPEDELFRALCTLFAEIDVNGDKSMEWEEFTKYIVEESVVSNQARVAVGIAEYEPVQSSSGSAPHGRHHNFIEKLCYVHELDRLLALEHKSSVVQVYNPATGGACGRITGLRGMPLAVEYIPQRKCLVFSHAELSMSLCDASEGPTQFQAMRDQTTNVPMAWPTPHAQTALRWVGSHSALYSGSSTGMVHQWDMAAREEVSCMLGHTDMVTDLQAMPHLDTLASSALDSVILLWDVHTCVPRLTLRGHKKGVVALAQDEVHRVVVSAGYDHEAFVWSPFVPSLVYKLKGHDAPLVGVENVTGTPQLVTADCEGVVKVWDVRTFRCVQSFTGEGAWRGMTTFTQCQRHRRLAIATKSLHFLEQKPPAQLAPLTDDAPLTKAVYNTTSLTIATAAAASVKVWDALNGKLLETFHDLTSAEISALCLDDRQRKLVVGDLTGRIGVFKYTNGAWMKDLQSHTRPVTDLIYHDAAKSVLSTSWDRSVLLQDEMDPDGAVVVRAMDGAKHQGDVVTSAFSPTLDLVATGAVDGTVRMWSLESYKLEAVLLQARGFYATCICFLGDLPAIAVSTSGGVVEVWSVRSTEHGTDYARLGAFSHRFRTAAAPPSRGANARDSPPARRPRRFGETLFSRPEDGQSHADWLQDVAAFTSNPKRHVPQLVVPASRRAAPDSEEGYAWGDAAALSLPFVSEDGRVVDPGRKSTVTAMAWGATERTLFTGDENGDLRAYDLTDALVAADLISLPPGRPPPVSNPLLQAAPHDVADGSTVLTGAAAAMVSRTDGEAAAREELRMLQTADKGSDDEGADGEQGDGAVPAACSSSSECSEGAEVSDSDAAASDYSDGEAEVGAEEEEEEGKNVTLTALRSRRVGAAARRRRARRRLSIAPEDAAASAVTTMGPVPATAPAPHPDAPFAGARALWRRPAHGDCVTSLQCVADPPCLLLASYDRMATLWSFAGELQGRLVQNAPDPYWRLPVDVCAKEAEERALAEEMRRQLAGDEAEAAEVVGLHREPLSREHSRLDAEGEQDGGLGKGAGLSITMPDALSETPMTLTSELGSAQRASPMHHMHSEDMTWAEAERTSAPTTPALSQRLQAALAASAALLSGPAPAGGEASSASNPLMPDNAGPARSRRPAAAEEPPLVPPDAAAATRSTTLRRALAAATQSGRTLSSTEYMTLLRENREARLEQQRQQQLLQEQPQHVAGSPALVAASLKARGSRAALEREDSMAGASVMSSTARRAGKDGAAPASIAGSVTRSTRAPRTSVADGGAYSMLESTRRRKRHVGAEPVAVRSAAVRFAMALQDWDSSEGRRAKAAAAGSLKRASQSQPQLRVEQSGPEV